MKKLVKIILLLLVFPPIHSSDVPLISHEFPYDTVSLHHNFEQEFQNLIVKFDPKTWEQKKVESRSSSPNKPAPQQVYVPIEPEEKLAYEKNRTNDIEIIKKLIQKYPGLPFNNQIFSYEFRRRVPRGSGIEIEEKVDRSVFDVLLYLIIDTPLHKKLLLALLSGNKEKLNEYLNDSYRGQATNFCKLIQKIKKFEEDVTRTSASALAAYKQKHPYIAKWTPGYFDKKFSKKYSEIVEKQQRLTFYKTFLIPAFLQAGANPSLCSAEEQQIITPALKREGNLARLALRKYKRLKSQIPHTPADIEENIVSFLYPKKPTTASTSASSASATSSAPSSTPLRSVTSTSSSAPAPEPTLLPNWNEHATGMEEGLSELEELD